MYWIEERRWKKSKSQPEETIAEKVKLRRQKAFDKELFDTSLNSTDESNRRERIQNLNSKRIVN